MDVGAIQREAEADGGGSRKAEFYLIWVFK